MSAAIRNICIPRNGHFQEYWQIADAAGIGIDITGAAIEMDFRSIAGDPTLLASATITFDEPENGIFKIFVSGADFDSYGSAFSDATASYDILITYPSGLKQVYVRGQALIIPEVTQ